MNSNLKQKLSELPASSGVYILRGRGGEILYLGKALSLRSRVRSYFQRRCINNPKMKLLVSRIEDIEIVLTDTEQEALVLENSLIKTHKPRFNILLRDDKNHPYLKFTLNEKYPRIYIVRHPMKDGAIYAGPFVPASLARRSMNLVHQLFGIRNCKEKLDGKRPRPCLQYQIKRCMAPCVDTIATLPEYEQASEQARLLLEGKNDDLLISLKRQMQKEADEERFELAARMRDMIHMLEDLGMRQKMAGVRGGERDIFGYYREGDDAVLQVFSMRSGKVVDRDSFSFEELKANDDEALVSASLKQYYELGRHLPPVIHVPMEFSDRELIEDWLSGKKGSKVEIIVPQRGGKRRLVELVCRNAKATFDLDFREEGRQGAKRVEALGELLGFPEPPMRIEGFDISNIQGSEIVASMVSFERGQPLRSGYRKFKIRSVIGGKPDDFASVREVLLRRYRRILEEGKELPDLVVIDGGKGQLSAAMEALEELGLSHLPMLSLAKKEERVYLPEALQPIILERHSPALQLLQQVRNEAHRFAIMFHRQQRKARSLGSSLQSIPGIGPKKRKKLLAYYGSLTRIKLASAEDLMGFLGDSLGMQVYMRLKELK